MDHLSSTHHRHHPYQSSSSSSPTSSAPAVSGLPTSSNTSSPRGLPLPSLPPFSACAQPPPPPPHHLHQMSAAQPHQGHHAPLLPLPPAPGVGMGSLMSSVATNGSTTMPHHHHHSQHSSHHHGQQQQQQQQQQQPDQQSQPLHHHPHLDSSSSYSQQQQHEQQHYAAPQAHHHHHLHHNASRQTSPPQWWDGLIDEVLLSADQLSRRVTQLGQELSHVYGHSNPLLLVVLKGSFLFAADLSRALPFEHQVEFIRAKSYQGSQTTGIVQLQGLESVDLTDRHVVIIEDIVDTGLTLRRLYDALQHAGAASVKCCTLLEKITNRRHHQCPRPDFVAFTIPDKFVVGYGLDHDQRFRHLPFVGVFREQQQQQGQQQQSGETGSGAAGSGGAGM